MGSVVLNLILLNHGVIVVHCDKIYNNKHFLYHCFSFTDSIFFILGRLSSKVCEI